MTTSHQSVFTTDPAGPSKTLLEEAVAGLSVKPRTLPCKLFYDRMGSTYFDRICQLPEYYPARTELQILRDNVAQVCECLGPNVALIELGSGSSIKTRVLLASMDRLSSYLPVDISREHLYNSAQQLRELFPGCRIIPVCADYTLPLNLPANTLPGSRRVVYFPGSTIGNLHPPQVRQFLRRLRLLVGPGGGLLIGIDLYKSPEVLLPAYNDSAGVTADFNRNILYRLRRDFGAVLRPRRFLHEARWNSAARRIEMHLVAKGRERILLNGQEFHFEPGESIWTESSYKYTVEGFGALCSGLKIRRVWTDAKGWFALLYLTAKSDSD